MLAFRHIIKSPVITILGFKNRSFSVVFSCCLFLLLIASCGSEEQSTKMPSSYKSLTTEKKMEYLLKNNSPEEVGRIVCEAALGKSKDGLMDLQVARDYAYSHYNENQIIQFEQASAKYEESLPLNEKKRFATLSGTEDLSEVAYGLGLGYVATIRENHKKIPEIEQELKALRQECNNDRAFYKRFMKGFKFVLRADRHRDLDEKVYLHFISYPDSIQ